METKEASKSKIRNSLSIKLIVITVLAMLLLIPTGMIRLLINERQDRRNEVISEITQGWGQEQTVCGPILTIPYYNYTDNTHNDNCVKQKNYLHILPHNISIDGVLRTTKKHRGIYEVVLYGSELTFEGTFKNINQYLENIPPGNILWEEAFLTIGITDLKGVRSFENIRWNDQSLKTEPELRNDAPLYSGITAAPVLNDSSEYHFNFILKLNGSEKLSFVPIGITTDVSLHGDWNCASAIGSFVSDKAEVDDSSFSMEWKIPESGRNAAQTWTGNYYSLDQDSFGVSLIMPVDNYQKTMRSNKYAILFIGLTFIVFLFAEILNKKRVHPVQYLLVGFGLVLFYSLLLALSEHLQFLVAYIIAGCAIILLITSYTFSVFKSFKITVSTFTTLTALYTFLYILLQLADYSLLAGNIGLFVILAAIMYFSRKIDWYNNKADTEEDSPTPANKPKTVS